MSYNTATSVDASYYPPPSSGDMQSMAPMGPDANPYWAQTGHSYAPLTLPTMDAVAAASGYSQVVPPPTSSESLDYNRVANPAGPPSLMPVGIPSTQPNSFMPHSQAGEVVHKALSSVSVAPFFFVRALFPRWRAQDVEKSTDSCRFLCSFTIRTPVARRQPCTATRPIPASTLRAFRRTTASRARTSPTSS